ncbi:hypothetical protein ACFOKI_12305 [Sphingomonas qilianensis]|uniref:Uncharacterized protein n=1 Tax=Sphingomonas qilianensis TaxID=1736690 RepID=A0ABU9XQE2_9SPHN
MTSNLHYYARRVVQEQAAARTAVTPAGRERRLALAEQFRAKLLALNG